MADTTPIYVNVSPVLSPPDIAPQIDAGAFVNQAEFSITDTGFNHRPYETLNTRFFTNTVSGIMFGEPGFRFDFFTNNFRGSMEWWVNNGSISADTSGGFFSGRLGGFTPIGNWLLVDSENIRVNGSLGVGAQGLLRLVGDDISVRRTGLRSGEPSGGFNFFGGTTFGSNYVNDLGISDLYWGLGANNALDDDGDPLDLDAGFGTNFFFLDQNFNIPNTRSPTHEVIEPSFLSGFQFTNFVSLPSSIFLGTNFLTSSNIYDAFVFTNQLNPTSAVIQVAFVPTNRIDTNFTVDVEFQPDFFGDNGASVAVRFLSTDFDIVTREFTTNAIYLTDHLAFETNAFLADNFDFPTQRPSTYELGRNSFFGFGTPRNAVFSPDLIWNPNYASNSVDITYAAYAASIVPPTQNDVTAAINPILSHPSNYSGRVEIVGDKVDLDQVRIRAESTIIIKAKDLSANGVAQVEAPFLVYDLATTEPTLTITNLAPPNVRRTTGAIAAYSAIWENQATTFITNGTTVITNTTDIQFHVLIVDPILQTLQPVQLTEFSAKATNVVLGDFLRITRKVQVETEHLQISQGVDMPPGAEWSTTNMIGVLNLTNDGGINITASGFFGADRDERYHNLINRGSIAGSSLFFDTEYLEVVGSQFNQGGGTIIARSGILQIEALEAHIEDSLMTARSELSITGDDFVITGSELRAGSNGFGGLVFNVTNRLCDRVDCEGVATTENHWYASTGVRMLQRPAYSDLLATTIESTAAVFRESPHVWAGEDMGPVPAGFTNNLALGRLILDGEDLTTFSFSGANGSNALYVDFIEFRNNATNYNSGALEIDPSLTIYFADSNISPEKLVDGVHGDRLQWVSSYTGPNSSTNLTYPSGNVYTFNLGVVRSKDLDSDGDGIVNLQDPTPIFVPESIDISVDYMDGPPLMALISWNALFHSTNTLEYSTNVDTGWMVLTNFVHGIFSSRVTVEDVIASGQPRFYRVRVDPAGP